MSERIAQRAGSALVWKAVQHAGVKGIFFVRLLILARLLAPDDFGLLAVSMVAIEVMNRVTNVGMIPALVQRATTEEAHYQTAWTIGILRAILIAGVVALAAPLVAELFEEPRAAPLMQVLALRPLLDASASIKVAALVRDLRFRSLVLIKVSDAVANTVVAVALAPGFGVWALVGGALAGPAMGLVFSYVLAPHRPRLVLDREAVRELAHFGRWIFVTGLIAVTRSSVLRLVITRQLGTRELGLYYLSMQLAFLLVEIADGVVGDVSFPLYARLQTHVTKATRAFKSVLTGVFVLLVPASALLIALTPALVLHVLGPQWEGTVLIIRVLAFASIIGLLGECIVPILKGVGQPSRVTLIEAGQTLVLVVFVWFFTRNWGLVGAAVAWLPAALFSQVLGIHYARIVLDRPFSGLLTSGLVIVGVALTGAILAAVLYTWYPGLWSLVLISAVAGVGMAGALWTLDRRFNLGLRDDLTVVFPRLAPLIGRFSR